MLASRFGGDSNDDGVDEEIGADTDDEDDDDSDGEAIVSEFVSLWSRVDVTPNPIS